MAAYVIIPTAAEWEVLNRILGALDEGGILVTPEAVEKLKESGFTEEQITSLNYIEDYDFGGDGDLWIDYARDDNYGFHELKRFLSNKDDLGNGEVGRNEAAVSES